MTTFLILFRQDNDMSMDNELSAKDPKRKYIPKECATASEAIRFAKDYARTLFHTNSCYTLEILNGETAEVVFEDYI